MGSFAPKQRIGRRTVVTAESLQLIDTRALDR